MARPDKIGAVLFDFDGTLADTEPLGFEFDRVAGRAWGVELTDEDLTSLIGTTGEDSLPAVFARHGVELTFAEFLSRRPDNSLIYKEVLSGLYLGAAELLRDLRARGVRLALVSTTDTYELLCACNRFGITGCFDAVIGGDMGLPGKPDPAPYLAAMEFLGVAPGECVVVEDSPVGIAAGRAAGAHTIAFTGGAIAQDVSAADETISSYEGFAL